MLRAVILVVVIQFTINGPAVAANHDDISSARRIVANLPSYDRRDMQTISAGLHSDSDEVVSMYLGVMQRIAAQEIAYGGRMEKERLLLNSTSPEIIQRLKEILDGHTAPVIRVEAARVLIMTMEDARTEEAVYRLLLETDTPSTRQMLFRMIARHGIKSNTINRQMLDYIGANHSPESVGYAKLMAASSSRPPELLPLLVEKAVLLGDDAERAGLIRAIGFYGEQARKYSYRLETLSGKAAFGQWDD